jgi:hypothetical protein
MLMLTEGLNRPER